VFFRVGDAGRATGPQPVEPEQPVYPVGEPVEELDPVTGLPVPFTIGEDNVALPGPNIMPRPEPEDGKDRKGKKKRDGG
jgi:hypothetical protein